MVFGVFFFVLVTYGSFVAPFIAVLSRGLFFLSQVDARTGPWHWLREDARTKVRGPLDTVQSLN